VAFLKGAYFFLIHVPPRERFAVTFLLIQHSDIFRQEN